jgi:hypothetical protein
MTVPNIKPGDFFLLPYSGDKAEMLLCAVEPMAGGNDYWVCVNALKGYTVGGVYLQSCTRCLAVHAKRLLKRRAPTLEDCKFLMEAQRGEFTIGFDERGFPYAIGAPKTGKLFSIDVDETPQKDGYSLYTPRS